MKKQAKAGVFVPASLLFLAGVVSLWVGYTLWGHALITAMVEGRAPLDFLNRVTNPGNSLAHYLERGDWFVWGMSLLAVLAWFLCILLIRPGSLLGFAQAFCRRKVLCAAAGVVLTAAACRPALPLGPSLLLNCLGLWVGLTCLGAVLLKRCSGRWLGRVAFTAGYAVVLGFCLFFLAYDPSFLKHVFSEDTFFENMTCLFLIFAGTALMLLGFRLKRSGGYRVRELFFIFAFGALFIFLGGEEISWGQRLLGFETPAEWAAINTQQEFNIHNLKFFHAPSIQWALVFILGFVIPVLNLLHRGFSRFCRRIGFLVMPFLSALCLLTAASLHYVPGSFEMPELFMSLGFLYFALRFYLGVKRRLPKT